MGDRYFEKFPTTTFQGIKAIDITRRVVPSKSIEANPYAYIPYTIEEGERADNVAYKVYQDADLSWAIFLANKTIDPYFSWPLDQHTWINYIVDRYGSIEAAQQKILYWENDWDPEQKISTAGYHALPDGNRRYWDAVFGEGSQILSYQRRATDIKATTNLMVMQEIEYANTSDQFRVGEIATFSMNGQPTGNGYVTAANVTTVQIQHVFGNTTASGLTVTGSNTGASATTVELMTKIFVIPEDEAVYYRPVYAYDHEDMLNAQRRQIVLFHPQYISDISRDLKKKLNT
jgi:hypothetical protein